MKRETFNRYYFDPETFEETYPYKLDKKKHFYYKNLEEKFNELFNNISEEEIQEKIKKEKKIRNLNEPSFIYGEVTFKTLTYILEYLYNVYSINLNGIFYDLGSGIGKAIFSAALTFPFKKYIGIEYIQTLNHYSNIIKSKFKRNFPLLRKEDRILNEKFKNITPDITFKYGDFLKENLLNASFIFINSTCFSNSLMKELSSKIINEVMSGCIIITITSELECKENEFEKLNVLRRYMAWGISNIYIYIKK